LKCIPLSFSARVSISASLFCGIPAGRTDTVNCHLFPDDLTAFQIVGKLRGMGHSQFHVAKGTAGNAEKMMMGFGAGIIPYSSVAQILHLHDFPKG
jgi:hypothetical protein